MIKIGLMGFDFNNPNKGCEALSYSFVNMISEIIDEKIEIHVFGYADLGRFPEKYPKIKFVWHRLKMKNPIYWSKLKKAFEECNCVFDITYGDGFSDIYGKVWNVNTDMAKQIANISRTPLVLLPQTYGPYENNFLKKWAVYIVKNCALALSRDQQSADEMSVWGCKKVIPATDLAFALPFDRNKYSLESDKIKIGINVSSLLWDGGHNINLVTNYQEYCRRIITKYTSNPNFQIHLIPHVIDKKNYDSLENDSRICNILHKEFPDTVLAPDFDTPIDAKSYICNMNVFIGARMHSTIGSMSSGVPTIPFSYSKKFEGLFGNLNYPYVISATQIDTNEAVCLTERYIQDRAVLEEVRKESIGRVNQMLSSVKMEIIKLLFK